MSNSVTMETMNPYLSSGNFAPIKHETTALELKTRGLIPRELNGRLLRIGPSPIGRAIQPCITGLRAQVWCTAFGCATVRRNGTGAASPL
jgi:hypothetical protein